MSDAPSASTTTAAICWPHSSSGIADDDGVDHELVTDQDVLDLGRGDVLAAADDRVVGPTLDEEVAVVVDPAAVLGGEPALVVDDRALVVLAGDLLAAQEHEADLADREGLVDLVADLDLDAGQDLADRPEAHGDRVAGEGGGVVVGPEHGDRRGGLGEPVGVHEADVGEQLEGPLEHGQRHAGAAVGERAQRGHLGGGAVEVVDDAGQHRRHDHGVGDALATHRLEPRLGVEGVEVDDAAAGVEVRQQVGHAGDVVRRHGDERRLVGVGAGELDGADHVGREVPMAQQGGLRRARGARRVEHDGDVVGIDERRQLDLAASPRSGIDRAGGGRR